MNSTLSNPGSYGSAYLAQVSDTVDQFFSAFMVTGATGTVSFQNAANVTIALTGVPIYVLIPVCGRRINVTGTGATTILLFA